MKLPCFWVKVHHGMYQCDCTFELTVGCSRVKMLDERADRVKILLDALPSMKELAKIVT